MLYPLIFQPIFKERIWGGRNLERLYQKHLPANIPVGESWEISDRPGDESVIAKGPFAGKSLHWLMENHRQDLLGTAQPAANGRFPLLIKILDAQEKLSLQVHPPSAKAAELHGEPKTELWYVSDATPAADLFVGLKKGATRAEFEKRIQNGTVAECFHRIGVKKGDAMFLPSGRVHALGAGNVIFEIQQNSDTTYRVFDWNRLDANGKPRELHIEQSLASIDFHDVEPSLISRDFVAKGREKIRPLVQDKLFQVDYCEADCGERIESPGGKMKIVGILEGKLSVCSGEIRILLSAGQFCLIPASVQKVFLNVETKVSFLEVQAG